MPRTTVLALTLAALLAASTSGCVGARASEAATTGADTAAARGPRIVPAETDAAVRHAGPEVRVRMRSKGDGPAAVEGSVVRVHYDAFVGGRNEPFASTRGLLEPLTVTIGGADSSIRGFQRGLIGLRPGARAHRGPARARLRPSREPRDRHPPRRDPHLRGRGAVRSMKSAMKSAMRSAMKMTNAARYALPLALTLSLVGCISFNSPKVGVEQRSAVATDSGLRMQEQFLGDGEPVATGDVVTFDYTMWLADGTRIDSTLDRGTPLTATVGDAPLAGLDEGLVGMRAGGRRRLELTPDLAYGAQGMPGLVPPDTSLVLEVHLLEVAPAP